MYNKYPVDDGVIVTTHVYLDFYLDARFQPKLISRKIHLWSPLTTYRNYNHFFFFFLPPKAWTALTVVAVKKRKNLNGIA